MKENNYNEEKIEKIEKRERSKSFYKSDKYEYLIPFYSEKNQFEIPQHLKIKDNYLDYIHNSINDINLELLNQLNTPICFKFKIFLLIFFGFILFLITLYISILICNFVLFNPMIFICIILFVFSNEMTWLVDIYFKIKVNSKLSRIKKKVNELNSKGNKYIWKVGRDFSWVTVRVNRNAVPKL